ncbi:MAG: CehA/McbA family metallohydrolase [Myxococcota bacterium]
MRLFTIAVLAASSALAQPLILEGELPDSGPDFVLVPFQVPAGTAEVEIRHPVQQPENILDYGLNDPLRTVGWGGGNTEPIVVNAQAASRSYLPGPMTAGAWSVVIGKAKVLVKPARYRLEIELRASPTLAAQPERAPYAHAQALSKEARWYAGDFHVHSRESGDAEPSLDAIATFARGRGLDFVELSDHNTTSQLTWIHDAQGRHPQLLFVPGVEFTTYAGHANGIGATEYVDHRFGLGDASFEAAVADFARQGAVLSINHPVLDLGTACIGCAWKLPIPRDTLGAVEIGTGGWDKTGVLFTKQAIAFWDRLVGQGVKAAAIGGSDDHSAGVRMGAFDSPIGNPTTLVFANELSVSALLEGLKAGRTVVKLQGPDDPMVDIQPTAVELDATGAPLATLVGATVRAPPGELPLRFSVSRGNGAVLKLLVDGQEREAVSVTSADFTTQQSFPVPETGETRIRAEVWVDGNPRTVTSHVFVSRAEDPPKGCGCGAAGAGAFEALALAALAAGRRRKITRKIASNCCPR